MWKGSLGISNETQWLQGMLSPIFAKTSVLNKITFGNPTLDLYGDLLNAAIQPS